MRRCFAASVWNPFVAKSEVRGETRVEGTVEGGAELGGARGAGRERLVRALDFRGEGAEGGAVDPDVWVDVDADEEREEADLSER